MKTAIFYGSTNGNTERAARLIRTRMDGKGNVDLFDVADLTDAQVMLDYDYDASTAVLDGFFCRLALDEDNQSHLSEARIERWCHQLQAELELWPNSPSEPY